MRGRRSPFYYLLDFLLVWALVTGFVYLLFYPDIPTSTFDRLRLLMVGPGVYLLGELFLYWLFPREEGRRLWPKPFSLQRILVALFLVLIWFGAGLLWKRMLLYP